MILEAWWIMEDDEERMGLSEIRSAIVRYDQNGEATRSEYLRGNYIVFKCLRKACLVDLKR